MSKKSKYSYVKGYIYRIGGWTIATFIELGYPFYLTYKILEG